jgi:tetraprenyl-beta-curcumene synthase
MISCYRKIFPTVHKELAYWTKRANEIENDELRRQALASIESKTFHCEGGGIYALLAQKQYKPAIRFIVAYQTISDYLDNLCDRSTSLDPDDFSQLHKAMTDALSPGASPVNYYAFRKEQNDGGYLQELVTTCQQVLHDLPELNNIQPFLLELAMLYSDLQVHKHVKHEERVERLKSWFQNHQSKCPDLSWYEFSACTGSTLGIFCLVSYGLAGETTKAHAKQIYQSYFPYMQGLHIMLDYFIDQQEDEVEGDLNFCSFYSDDSHLRERLLYIMERTKAYLNNTPHQGFHQLVQNGLVGMYLADKKVKKVKRSKEMIKQLLKVSGKKAKFFYVNTKLYVKLRPFVR